MVNWKSGLMIYEKGTESTVECYQCHIVIPTEVFNMIKFREITEEEIPEVSELYTKLLLYIQSETKDEYFVFNNLSDINLINKLKDDMADRSRRIFIAVENKKIIGFIAGEIIGCFLPISKIKKVGYISGAYVDDEYRNKGIMKKLEKMITIFFKEHDLEFAELNVISNNFIGKKSWDKLGYNTFREQMRKKL